MELRRTAVVKLAVPDERHGDLKRTMNTFRDAAQRFADRGWKGDDDGYITSRSRLQRLVYDEIRTDTTLHSDLCVGAANHAAEALSTCVEKMKDGKRTSNPVFTSNTTVYNTNAISYFDGYCSLAAYGGRVHAEYVYPEDSIQAEYVDGDEWAKKGAKLRYDRHEDTYYLHVTVVREREQQGEAESQSVLGVDTNVDGYLGVTSTGAFIGNADRLNHERREYESVPILIDAILTLPPGREFNKTELAEHAGVTRQTVSNYIDVLLETEVVEEVPNASPRRYRVVKSDVVQELFELNSALNTAGE
jgi:putative transposase